MSRERLDPAKEARIALDAEPRQRKQLTRIAGVFGGEHAGGGDGGLVRLRQRSMNRDALLRDAFNSSAKERPMSPAPTMTTP